MHALIPLIVGLFAGGAAGFLLAIIILGGERAQPPKAWDD